MLQRALFQWNKNNFNVYVNKVKRIHCKKTDNMIKLNCVHKLNHQQGYAKILMNVKINAKS